MILLKRLLACDLCSAAGPPLGKLCLSVLAGKFGNEREVIGLSYNVTLPGLFVLPCTQQSDPFVRNSLLWQNMSEQSGNSFLVVMATYSLGSS